MSDSNFYTIELIFEALSVQIFDFLPLMVSSKGARPGPAQWAEGFKNKIFCLQILFSCAQIDPWDLI